MGEVAVPFTVESDPNGYVNLVSGPLRHRPGHRRTNTAGCRQGRDGLGLPHEDLCDAVVESSSAEGAVAPPRENPSTRARPLPRRERPRPPGPLAVARRVAGRASRASGFRSNGAPVTVSGPVVRLTRRTTAVFPPAGVLHRGAPTGARTTCRTIAPVLRGRIEPHRRRRRRDGPRRELQPRAAGPARQTSSLSRHAGSTQRWNRRRAPYRNRSPSRDDWHSSKSAGVHHADDLG